MMILPKGLIRGFDYGPLVNQDQNEDYFRYIHVCANAFFGKKIKDLTMTLMIIRINMRILDSRLY